VREHVGDEMAGQFVFGVQYPQQLFLLDYQQRAPNIATTASLPEPLTTDNFTLPFCTYITVSAESPWERMDSFLRYSMAFLERPNEVTRDRCAGVIGDFGHIVVWPQR
jgi:hypothetical protein